MATTPFQPFPGFESPSGPRPPPLVIPPLGPQSVQTASTSRWARFSPIPPLGVAQQTKKSDEQELGSPLPALEETPASPTAVRLAHSHIQAMHELRQMQDAQRKALIEAHHIQLKASARAKASVDFGAHALRTEITEQNRVMDTMQTEIVNLRLEVLRLADMVQKLRLANRAICDDRDDLAHLLLKYGREDRLADRAYSGCDLEEAKSEEGVEDVETKAEVEIEVVVIPKAEDSEKAVKKVVANDVEAAAEEQPLSASPKVHAQ